MGHAPGWLLEACRPPLWLLARLYLRLRFVGVEHVPTRGAVLITPNHVSYMDPVLVSLPIHRPLHYLALEPFFRVPGLGPLIRWCRAWPVREGEPNAEAARTALRVLRAGEALVIFPEGGRSRDGRLQPFFPGAFRLALAAGAPVVPVSIAGAHASWPPSRRWPRPGRVCITYHPALTARELPAGVPRAQQAALLAELARERIASAL